ncbi:hypothetical protein AX15_004321 [Amanita polypyramis BW_CC]|nr:hypothetical protein AX15_004321 [Amanita polypyramis BW_CC]
MDSGLAIWALISLARPEVFNSLGQSPCEVAEILAGSCDPAGFNIPPLPSGQVYFGPTSSQANSCQCSSVFYSLLSACALCQDRQWISWSPYSANCSQVYLTVYNNTISANTGVPHWAYLNVSINGTFTYIAAQDAVGPESTRAPSSTSTSTSTSRPKSSNHAGAIAGGVIGGVVFVALVAGAAFWLYNRSKTPGKVAWTSVQTHGQDALPAPPPPTGQPMYQLQKLYDPHDPTTFPPAIEHQNTASSMDPSLTGTTYAPHTNVYKAQGGYTGVPEV